MTVPCNESYEGSEVKQSVRNTIAKILQDFHRKTGQPISGVTLPGENALTETTINHALGMENCKFECYERFNEVYYKALPHMPPNSTLFRDPFPFDDTFDGVNFVYADLCGFATVRGEDAKTTHRSAADSIARIISNLKSGVVAVTFCSRVRHLGGKTDSLRQMGVPSKDIPASLSPEGYAKAVVQYILRKAKHFNSKVLANIAETITYKNGKHQNTDMMTLVFLVNYKPLQAKIPNRATVIAKVVKYMNKHPVLTNYELSSLFNLSPQRISGIRVRHFKVGKFANFHPVHA